MVKKFTFLFQLNFYINKNSVFNLISVTFIKFIKFIKWLGFAPVWLYVGVWACVHNVLRVVGLCAHS